MIQPILLAGSAIQPATFATSPTDEGKFTKPMSMSVVALATGEKLPPRLVHKMPGKLECCHAASFVVAESPTPPELTRSLCLLLTQPTLDAAL